MNGSLIPLATSNTAQTYVFVLELTTIASGVAQFGNTSYLWWNEDFLLRGLTPSNIVLGTTILQKCVLLITCASNDTKVYINDPSTPAGSNAETVVDKGYTNLGWGGGVYSNMDLFHVSHFDKVLSAQEITDLMTELKTRHSIV